MVVTSSSMCVLVGMVVLLQTGFGKCSVQATTGTGTGENGRTDIFSSAYFSEFGTYILLLMLFLLLSINYWKKQLSSHFRAVELGGWVLPAFK